MTNAIAFVLFFFQELKSTLLRHIYNIAWYLTIFNLHRNSKFKIQSSTLEFKEKIKIATS